ncbi:hypothetical protein P5G86_09455 [Paenibacillus jamilae]|uniref:Uncharacterized protein n=1 Tax=Bacillus thuringiensis serovar subtoxicus TaxID=475791 RepID=A0A9X6IIK8_BACTU|nr:hypothetical protein [Bacillus thuringiensis]MEB4840300.1 hypothetical protein [Paenibacillus jamilae]MEB8580873.1 hypothetical protein [Bacillus cereus]MCR6851522.1 hypothetical protein [Bacillus thuringiensis]MDR4283036.1 hypothetical protein [Bacillus thuringiensis]MEB8593246.1 hypothetical protein [Bacillus cereus]
MGEFISRRAECERRTAQLQKVALQRAIKHIEAQAKINTRKKSGATARTITSKVTGEGQNLQAIVGGNDDNLIYEEFGTGIYSEKNGRKTPWKYKDKTTGKWYVTRGKKGTRAMRKAGESSKGQVKQIIAQTMKGGIGK